MATLAKIALSFIGGLATVVRGWLDRRALAAAQKPQR
jgi:hypothetical protein